MKPETLGYVVLALMGLFVLYTAAHRMQEGRCLRGGVGGKSAIDCGYPPGTAGRL